MNDVSTQLSRDPYWPPERRRRVQRLLGAMGVGSAVLVLGLFGMSRDASWQWIWVVGVAIAGAAALLVAADGLTNGVRAWKDHRRTSSDL